ncbi:hypothetical protein [Achromobacter xylosoxidans]|uniref:Lipoprotein n=1 Tax=Alcaligenes xylosoxydans xylosoxydans TaxID=85698 RepID=A0A1R1JKA5_ALCXX|nr:hypothetical protein [Achromobacter xylosoxidans]OMG76190.1 hypothetical protein BIZ92_18075 [Achromobacter xylosoxidans]BEG75300.1 hypothetical protein HBIAX_02356 [Achromobacter xylosoxidans]
MNLGKILFSAAAVVAVAGCTTMGTNEAIVPLQSATAQMIGLASSDELTITNVKADKADSLGAQNLTYTATTTKGRRFDCTSRMMPGLLTSPPTLTTPSCTPVQVHSIDKKK